MTVIKKNGKAVRISNPATEVVALSDAALGAVVTALNRSTAIHEYRLGIMLLAQTLVRPSEMLWASWRDVDLEGGFWRVVHDKRRGGTGFAERRLPLPAQALATLKSLHDLRLARLALAPNTLVGDWLVTSHSDRAKAATADALGKVVRRAVEAARMNGAVVGNAVLYSLRNTGIEWLLDQTDKPGLVQRLAGLPLTKRERELPTPFDPERNLPEQAALMQRWANHIDECLALK